MLGKSNWWFPKTLDRILPRLGLDPGTITEEAVALGAGDGSPVAPEVASA
jgi:hypothetical protein